MQYDKGSRFFLPDKMRTQIYQKLLQSVEHSGQDDALLCQVCMNPLDQPELKYSDNSPAYKWMRFPIGTFIKTDCSHIFHPNCILESITLNSVCPVCKQIINIDGFDD